jgi:hypothetical protein
MGQLQEVQAVGDDYLKVCRLDMTIGLTDINIFDDHYDLEILDRN